MGAAPRPGDRAAMATSSSRRTPQRAATSLAAALLLLGACGPAAREAAPGAAEALSLAPAVPPPEITGAARVTALPIPPDIEPWTVYANRAGIGPPAEAADAEHLPDGLYLYGNDPKNVLVPGPFEPGAFNRVAVTLLIKVHNVVEVQLLRDGRPVVSGGAQRVWSSDLLQRVVADLPRAALEREPFDALRIRIGVNAGPVCLHAVELVDEPVRAWLGPPGDAPAPRSISGDQRPAVLLTSEVPLHARFEAAPGRRLALSCGVAERLRFPRQRPRLRVRVTGAGEELVRELALDPSWSEPLRWLPLELDLSRWRRGALEARFELLVDGPQPGFAFLAEARLVAPQADPPTVLLVTSDTHRADHLGAAREHVALQTPALDALAERGLLFERCYSTSNVTVPSHVAMLTGLHPRDTRVVDNITTLVREAATLAEAFRAAGWRTFAAVSAYHLGDELSGLGQGFARMSSPRANERRAAETCAVARGWLDEERAEPLFLWLHLFDAHGPYAPPEEYAAPYEAEPAPGLAPKVALERARYRGEVSYLDAQLGELFTHPRLARAVVAVTADHGECLGQHEIYWAHEGLYTDTIHVPLVIAWPGGPAGVRIERPVQNLHLGRTLLDLAGLADAPFPGSSLVAEAGAGEPLFALSASGEEASITAGDWHLVLYLSERRERGAGSAVRHELHELELYDLASDPGCELDRAASEPERARELRRALVRWLGAAPAAGLASEAAVDPERRARLEGLGYAAESGGPAGGWFDPDCGCAQCARHR